jgi:dolichyl-phosphate-mannose-protein mannosyltransferase
MIPHHRGAPTSLARRDNPQRWVYYSAIVILGVIVRAWGVGRYPGLIYDEYYYVPAADILLHQKPPVVVKHAVWGIDPNLLSHPPLAKELIAAAIWTFGNHPWAWRLPGVVLGSTVPLVVAGLAWDMFHDRRISYIASLLAATNGLLITMSRVALPDSTAVPLVLFALWAFWRVSNPVLDGQQVSWLKWIGVGFLFGAALSAEWIGGQALVLAGAWLIGHWRKTRQQKIRWLVSGIVVPLVTYFCSYFYAWPHGFQEPWLPRNLIVAFFKLQWLILKGMWTLRFYHPWTSNAWSWLAIPRPTALILSVSLTQSVRMMATPDPFVVWGGLACLAAAWGWRRYFLPRRAWLFLTLWLLAFYATWLLTPRSKFTYYFTTASVGLDVAMAAGLVTLAQTRIGQRVALAVATIVAGSVLYLMPLAVGMALPRPWYHALWWPPSWNPRVRASPSVTTRSFSLTYTPTQKPVAVGPWSGFCAPFEMPVATVGSGCERYPFRHPACEPPAASGCDGGHGLRWGALGKPSLAAWAVEVDAGTCASRCSALRSMADNNQGLTHDLTRLINL